MATLLPAPTPATPRKPDRRQACLLTGAALIGLAAGVARAETGVGDKELLIGQFAALSGPAAELGKRLQLGILAAFRSVNAAGGVHGRQLRLVSRDDGYEPDQALAAATALVRQDKVFALIGSVGTPTTLAALPLIDRERVPLVGPFTGAQALREPFNRNLFHVRASYFDETERIVQHLVTLGIRKIAVFYQDDSYGKAGLAGVARALDKRKLAPVATMTVARNSTDVSGALRTLLQSGPDAVVQISAYASCAALIRGAREKGFGGQFFNVSFVGSEALARAAGPAGVGVTIAQVVPFPYTASLPVVRDYQEALRVAGTNEFDFTSLEGYLAARVLAEGLRRAGRNLSRTALVSALESITDLDLGGFRVTYGPQNHEGSHFTDLTLIGRDARFVR